MDLGIQFFTAAKAQHESGAKWSLIVLIVLVYFHLAIISPFARQTAEKGAIEQDLVRNFRVEEQLSPIVDSAAAFVGTVESQLNEASAALRQDLVDRFRLLDEKIQGLAALTRQQAEGEEGAQLFRIERAVMIQQQQQQQPTSQSDDLVAPLEPMPSRLRGLVAEEARNPSPESQYGTEMERHITASVLAPAFKRANETWAADRLQPLIDQAAQLDAGIVAALKNADGAADQLRALQAAVAALRDDAQRLSFAPPAGSNWWRTISGKDSSIRSMIDAMTMGIGKIGQQKGVLEAAKEKASAAILDNQKRADEIAERLVELEQQASDLQAQLGEIGEPLKVISIRLSLLAPLLPLVIALAIAALTLWRAEALRRMRFAASLVATNEEGSVLRRWLEAAAGGSMRLLAAREIVIASVAIAWVLAAWWAVRSLPEPDLPDAVIVGIALAVLLAGRAYHWHQCHQALAFVAQR